MLEWRAASKTNIHHKNKKKKIHILVIFSVCVCVCVYICRSDRENARNIEKEVKQKQVKRTDRRRIHERKRKIFK